MDKSIAVDEEGNAKKKLKLCIPTSEDENDGEELEDFDESHLDEDEASDEEDVEEDSESEGEGPAPKSDPYTTHFEYQLPEDHSTDKIQYDSAVQYDFDELGTMSYYRTHLYSSGSPSVKPEINLKKNLNGALKDFSPLQLDFLNLLTNYYDISYMQRTYRKGELLRKAYALHILNHILISRAKVIHHNSKLAKNPDEEFRDQGFVRPTVIVLLPFRHDCHRVVKDLTAMLPGCVVTNKKRFENEYGPPPKRHRAKPKPQEFEQTFEGNIDEDFKIGVSIKNKSVSLYSEFYKCDLILASPLGLRQIIGSEGEKERDYDFLSSVEILILDRVDIQYLQNLVHLNHVLKHFNLLPKESHGCDFSRVRLPYCDGKAKMFRQTVLISNVEHRWFESVLLHNFCTNYKGYLCSVSKPKTVGVNLVFVTLKMCFRLFEFSNPALEFEDRFKFFAEKVLPEFKDPEMAQTLIYIPSYFDFVRLRNYFREQELSATMICEYSSSGKVAEARNNFFKERRHFMLYTERAHFYHRYSLKGIQHILFYQPPTYPNFFKDMNFALLDSNPRRKFEEKSCTVIASKLDLLQLKQMVGLSKAKRMLTSTEKIFVQQIVR